MKKVLSIVLSICLLVTSMSAVLTQSVSATTIDYSFENADIWSRYKYSSSVPASNVIGGEGAQTTKGYSITSSNAYTEDGKCVALTQNISHFVAKLPTLKQNTDYTLSFKFMVPTATTSSSQFFNAYIVNDGATLTKATAFSDGDFCTTGVAPDPKNGTGDGVYHDYSISFTTDNRTNLYLSIYPRLATSIKLYLDEFVLEEVPKEEVTVTFKDGDTTLGESTGYEGEALTTPDAPTKLGYEFAGWTYEDGTVFDATTFPAENTTVYAKWNSTFETQTNWGMYSAKDAVINGTATAPSSGNKYVSIDTLNTATGSGSSLKIVGNITNYAIEIPNLIANTEYNLSFKYMIPSSTTQSSSYPWIYTKIVVKDTTTQSQNTPNIGFFTTTNDSDLNDGTWRDATITFNTSESTDLFFVSYGRFGSTGTVVYYLDEFVLTAVETYTPVTITFETNGGDPIDSLVTKAGEQPTLPEATKSGKVFAGWYTDENCTQAFDTNAPVNENITLYADWADFKYDKSGSKIVSDTPLCDLGSFGDVLNVSFEYRVLSGSAGYYGIANNGSIGYLQDATKLSGENVINYNVSKGSLDSSTTDWQQINCTFSIKGVDAFTKYYTDTTYETPIELDASVLLNVKPSLYVTCTNAVVYVRAVEITSSDKTSSLDAGTSVAICHKNYSKLNKDGIRVKNEIKTAWIEDHNIVEYGSIVTYKKLLDNAGDTELTFDSNATKVVGVAYSSRTVGENKDGSSGPKEALFDTSDPNAFIHTSYLVGIESENFAEDIVVRNYAIDANGKIFYDNGASKLCMYDAINAVSCGYTATGSAPSENDVKILTAFVSDDTVATAYKEWCAVNKKETGALFDAIYPTTEE